MNIEKLGVEGRRNHHGVISHVSYVTSDTHIRIINTILM